MSENNLWTKLSQGNLVLQIVIGIIAGIIIAMIAPEQAVSAGIFGSLFVGALKAVAPILVFILVAASILNHKKDGQTKMKSILTMYLTGTLIAALIAVVLSFIFPTQLVLVEGAQGQTPPKVIGQVLQTLLFQVVDNPINALTSANYIGILAWSIGLGIALRHASDTTKTMFNDLSTGVSQIVRFIIRLAPFGIFGLVSKTVATTGFDAIASYGQLLFVLLSAMLIMAFLVNPALVLLKTGKNPYPLVLQCLRESGVTAFFTRSSAANIPVNMALCKKLNLNEETYSMSIPLGATINMAGAAITITTLTLAAVNTLNIQIDIFSALLLSVVAAVSACGASGVAGGSLLLIPLACGLFGISNDVALQVVAIGFIIGVIQDSAETALNSSTDVVYTAAVCQAQEQEAAQKSSQSAKA